MNRKVFLSLAVMFLLVAGSLAGGLIAGSSLAQSGISVPSSIHYQGVLCDPVTGDPVADGGYNFVFSIYSVATGGTPLWTETQTGVTVEDGYFSVLLGSISSLSASLFDGTPRYLGIKVGSDDEMTPRQLLASVPYALQAENADTVDGMEGAGLEESAEIDADIAAHALNPSAHHTRYTDVEAWAAVLASDGSGSGLDADMLDGMDSSNFVAVAGDTMTGTLNLPANGLVAGTDQFVLTGGGVGIGTTSPDAKLEVAGDVKVSGAGNGVIFPDGTKQTTATAGVGSFPPPAFDSGWVEIAQWTAIQIVHNLGGNVDNYLVDMEQKFEDDPGINHLNYGSCSGSGLYWSKLTTNSIEVRRPPHDWTGSHVRIRIWVYE